MTFIIDPHRFGVPNPIVNSLEFDGSTDYLSASDVNWGSYDRAKFAIAGSFRADAVSGTYRFFGKWQSDTAASNEFSVGINSSKLFFDCRSPLESNIFTSATPTLSTATWYAFLIYFDRANATSQQRIRIYINGTDYTPTITAPTQDVNSSSARVVIGANNTDGSNTNAHYDGLLYSLAFFSGSLPSTSDVFNGTSGKLKDLTGLTGLHSLLTANTNVEDYLLNNWANNGTVTTSATVP